MAASAWRVIALFALFATPSCSLRVGAVQMAPTATVRASSSSPFLVTTSRAALGAVVMQEQGRETSKSKGRIAVIQRPKPKPKQSNKEEVDKDKSWRVLLHNDDVSIQGSEPLFQTQMCFTILPAAGSPHAPRI